MISTWMLSLAFAACFWADFSISWLSFTLLCVNSTWSSFRIDRWLYWPGCCSFCCCCCSCWFDSAEFIFNRFATTFWQKRWKFLRGYFSLHSVCCYSNWLSSRTRFTTQLQKRTRCASQSWLYNGQTKKRTTVIKHRTTFFPSIKMRYSWIVIVWINIIVFCVEKRASIN